MSLLGLDIGTTNCKGAVFTEDGRCLARAHREYPTLRPRPGWVELDSARVMDAAFDIVREVAATARQARDPVRAIAVSALGEALTPVSRDRKILGNAILHADTRGQEELDAFMAKISASELYAINPNIASTAYSLVKLLWCQKHAPELYRQADKFLFFGDLLFFLLGCEPVTSFSQANRTLLFDLDQETWSDRLLQLGGIDAGKLPRPVASGTIAGRLSGTAGAGLGLEAGVICVVGAHDQCSNALGVGVCAAGKAVDGIGTVECVTPVFGRVPDRHVMRQAGLHIEHHAVPGLYVSFIYNQAGSLIKWFRHTFARAETAAIGEDIYDRLTTEMPENPTRLLVLPHFEPTGAPGFIGTSSGVILGLLTSTTRGDILKAIMEGETYYFLEAVQTLAGMGIDTSCYLASGGGAKSSAWLQIKADIMGVPFERTAEPEAGTLGAAIIAGKAVGSFASYAEACARVVRRDRVFEPDASRHAAYLESFVHYQQLHARLKDLLAYGRG